MATFQGPGPDAIYEANLAEGRFTVQRCDACDTHIFYPRVTCIVCGAPEPSFVVASGKGTVYSTTTQRRKPEQGGDVNLALVDLAEGPRMMTRIDGIASTDVKPGLAVTARIVEEDGRRFVVFVPV
jgi:uncharacterized protein